jgi:hypothetical protein
MTSFRGQASWAKMVPPKVKVTAQAYHPTKNFNTAEKVINPSLSSGHARNFKKTIFLTFILS